LNGPRVASRGKVLLRLAERADGSESTWGWMTLSPAAATAAVEEGTALTGILVEDRVERVLDFEVAPVVLVLVFPAHAPPVPLLVV